VTYPQVTDENLPDEAELSTAAHGELDQHRELREMVRLAAWEMPLLANLAKPFKPPKIMELPLRWRYTTYFGETHPNSRKVVVTFQLEHLGSQHGLSPDTVTRRRQLEKLKKLAGPRYNPDRNCIKMSCENFETVAMNKRYLADLVTKVLHEAADLEGDDFEDVPLDLRHHKPDKTLIFEKHFPREWKLDAEKRVELLEKRRQVLLEEGKRVADGKIVDGAAEIERDRQVKLSALEEQSIMEEAKIALPTSKMGKKEMKRSIRASIRG
jgi:small subunit ribosomal protein S35